MYLNPTQPNFSPLGKRRPYLHRGKIRFKLTTFPYSRTNFLNTTKRERPNYANWKNIMDSWRNKTRCWASTWKTWRRPSASWTTTRCINGRTIAACSNNWTICDWISALISVLCLYPGRKIRPTVTTSTITWIQFTGWWPNHPNLKINILSIFSRRQSGV